MTDKVVFTRVAATGNLQSLISNYNSNLDALESAINDSLSLSGKLPNSLEADLDANSNRIINLLDAETPSEPATKRQLDEAVLDNLSLGSVQSITFDTASTDLSAVGRFVWNDQDGTLDLGLKGGNVTMQIGQEIFARVVNKTGSDFLEANYQVVKIDGAQGQRMKVALAQANSAGNASGTLGVVTETIANNQEGFVTLLGLVRDINTTGSLQGETWAEGDTLWLSSKVAGRITNIAPVSGIKCKIGIVEKVHATQGKIFVHVENFSGMGDAEYVDVKDYGATGAGKIAFTANISSGSSTLTLLNATGIPQDLFSPSDVGKEICISWAGTNQANHYTTISSYISPYSVTIATPAVNSTPGNSMAAWWPVGQDDTTAINAAIQATSSGGPTTVLIPAGVYVYKNTDAFQGAIVNTNAPMLTGITGGGGRRTWLVAGNSATISKAISISDPNVGFRMEKFSVFGPGISGVAGGDIEFKLVNQSNCDQMVIENVNVYHSAGYGFNIPVPILVEVKNCKTIWTAVDGFFYRDGTSIHFNGCYALAAGQCGFRAQVMSYSAHTACAVEGAGIGFYAKDSNTLVYNGCGGEDLLNRTYNGAVYNGSMFVIDGGSGGVTINSCYGRDLALTGSRHVKTLNSASNVTVTGYRTNNIAVTPTYDFEITSGSSFVSFINCTPDVSRVLDAGTASAYYKGRNQLLP